MKFLPILASAMLMLSGCGMIYFAPKVSETGTEAEVNVVTLDAKQAQLANVSPYTPRQLPAVFLQTAGTAGSFMGAGALPEPVLSNQGRPPIVATRLPEEESPTPYEIGVGDVLVLATQQSATSIEELSGLLAAQNRRQGYTVQDDGAIAVPDVGRVELAGLNLEEAEAVVFQALVENQLDPTFSIEVAEFNSKRATIGGAVRNPTVIPISLSQTTIQEALAAAGGVNAPDDEFVTIRLYRDGTLYQVPLSRIPGTNVTLKAGDSIFVDTDFQLELAQAYFEEQITLANTRRAARTAAINDLATEIRLRREELDEARSNFETRLDLGDVKQDFVYYTGAARGR